MTSFSRRALPLGIAVLPWLAACSGGGTTSTDTDPNVHHLALSPPENSVRVGGQVQFTVTVYNRKNEELTGNTVSWESLNPTIATVSGDNVSGVATGVSQGVTTIIARSGTVSALAQLTVSNVPVAQVTVTGASSVEEGARASFTAAARDANNNILTGRSVEWSSSDPTIASVFASGEVTGVRPGGPVSIKATIEGVAGSAPITVMAVPVANVSVSGVGLLNLGQTATFMATAKNAQGGILSGRTFTWSSSNPAIANVSANGVVTANAPGGPVTITANCEGKLGTAQVSVVGAPSFISGRVINYVTGQGIGGASVSFRANDGIGTLIAGATAGADGTFTSPGVSSGFSGGVLIEASATGYVTGRILIGGVPPGATTYAGDVPLAPSSSTTGGISGVVRNARTAGGVSGATVSLFNNVSSAAIATRTSDGAGNFSFTGISAGTYRLTATASGFQDAQRIGVAVGDGGVTANQDLVMSPSGTSAITIVLTWGASPSDLDSHLTGPNTDGSRFHVYYASRGSLTGAPFVNLDVDDTQSYGPETVTILQMNTGTYRYSIHDFTNRNSNPSTGLGSSGAKVQVYTSSGLAQTFSVPGGAGTLWTVFELSGTLASPVITPVNTMSYASNSAAIPAPPVGFGTMDAILIGIAAREHPKGNPR